MKKLLLSFFALLLLATSCELNQVEEETTTDAIFAVSYLGNGNDSGEVPAVLNYYYAGETVIILDNRGDLAKTSHVLTGWNTEADGSGTAYQPNDAFVMPEHDVDLYAQWVPTYTITYDGNGNDTGVVPVDSSAYLAGDVVTILANTGKLKKTNYEFYGWNTAADGSGYSYVEGDTFLMGESDMQVYAQWQGIDTDVQFDFRTVNPLNLTNTYDGNAFNTWGGCSLSSSGPSGHVISVDAKLGWGDYDGGFSLAENNYDLSDVDYIYFEIQTSTGADISTFQFQCQPDVIYQTGDLASYNGETDSYSTLAITMDVRDMSSSTVALGVLWPASMMVGDTITITKFQALKIDYVGTPVDALTPTGTITQIPLSVVNVW